VASGVWSRAADLNSWSQVPGAFCFVEQGTVNADTGWLCTSDQGGTLGTTAINWTQFAGPGTYTAGGGLSLSGSQFAAVIGSSGGSEAWSAELDGLATLNTTGLVARTGTHTYAARAIAVPAGMSISNPTGAGGNPTISLANDLNALENLTGTNNVYYRSAADTWTSVTFGGMLSWSGGTLNVAPSTDTALGGGSSSDGAVPSQKAVRSYANANIGGLAISTDTLAQGQGWVWDGQSSTFKACDVVEPNLLVNPSFDIWQENTSYTFGSTAPKTHIADFWKVGGATTNAYTAAQVAGINGSQFALNIKRNSGQTTVSRVRLAQQLGQAEAMFLAGKNVVVSFDYMIGANYSPTSGPFVTLIGGTGIDEDLDLHANGTLAFTTGSVSTTTGSLAGQVAAAGTSARIITPSFTVPTGITEFALEFHLSGFVGTAGADDSFTIGNVKLEIGGVATPYRKPLYGDELRRCQYRYQKSFYWNQQPIQGLGTTTGEVRWRRVYGASGVETTRVQLMTPMRFFPTVALYNPVGSNSQVREESSGADCTVSGALNVSDTAFDITCNNPASGGAVGDWLGVHWTADARL
jgi:hypothetical protein